MTRNPLTDIGTIGWESAAAFALPEIAEPRTEAAPTHIVVPLRGAWQKEFVQVGSTSVVFVGSPSPAATYAERLSGAVRQMRRQLEQRFGTGRVLAKTRPGRYGRDEGDESVNVLVFSGEVADANAEDRADALAALIDYLVAHPDTDVRHDLAVEVF